MQRKVSLSHDMAIIAGKRAREPIPGVKAPPKVTTGGQHSDTPAAKVQRLDSGTPSASTRKLSTQRQGSGIAPMLCVVNACFLAACQALPVLRCCSVLPVGMTKLDSIRCDVYCAAVMSRC